jgi:hypothetical protein
MTTALITKAITPSEVFVPKGLDPILAGVREKVKEIKAKKLDMSVKKNRDELRTFASDVGKSKTFIDKARVKFVSDKKAALKVIDSECKKYRDTMDEIKIDVRIPLTEWEAAEDVKKAAERLQIEIDMDHEEALGMEDLFNREKEMARKEAEMAQAEEERIAKEQAEQAEKDRIENEVRIKKEAEDQAKFNASEEIKWSKIKRITDLGLVIDSDDKQWTKDDINISVVEFKTLNDDDFDALIIKVKKEIDRREKEKIESDRIAAEEQAKANQEAAVKKAQEDATAKVKAEKDAEERRIAEENRIAEKKAANTRHQAHVNNKIKDGLMTLNIDKETAKKIIIATAKGEIEFLKILY